MDSVIRLSGTQDTRTFHGGRVAGQRMRLEIEEALDEHGHVILDFAGVGVATQSFIDEAIGVMILRFGPEILHRISFRNCNKDIRAVLHYVAASRAEDYRRRLHMVAH